MNGPAPSINTARAGLFVAAICALLAAFLVGWLSAGRYLRAQTSVSIVPDTREGEPVVSVQGIVNGELLLKATGDVRIVAGDQPIQPDAQGMVRMRDRALLTNRIEIVIPAGMRFVASKRGQKYYAVDASAAQGIVPENRVYFPDAAAAENAGYTAD